MTGKNEGGNNVFIYWEQVFNCASQESFPDSVEWRWCLNHFKLAKLPDLLSPQIYFLHLFLLHVSNITSLCCDIKKISHAFIKANTLQEKGSAFPATEGFSTAEWEMVLQTSPKAFLSRAQHPHFPISCDVTAGAPHSDLDSFSTAQASVWARTTRVEVQQRTKVFRVVEKMWQNKSVALFSFYWTIFVGLENWPHRAFQKFLSGK